MFRCKPTSRIHPAARTQRFLVASRASFYDELGVSPSSSDDEIKTAFRQQAKRWHPDVNKEVGGPRMNSPHVIPLPMQACSWPSSECLRVPSLMRTLPGLQAEAEARFIRINDAYQTLSDGKLRAQYDRERAAVGLPPGLALFVVLLSPLFSIQALPRFAPDLPLDPPGPGLRAVLPRGWRVRSWQREC